jgi:hypothetical protein
LSEGAPAGGAECRNNALTLHQLPTWCQVRVLQLIGYMSSGQEPENNPDSLKRDVKDLRTMFFVQQAMIIRLSSEVSAHREAIAFLGDKNDIKFEGKSLGKYIQDKIDQANNTTLAGLSDYSPNLATFLSNTLKQPPKDDHPAE